MTVVQTFSVAIINPLPPPLPYLLTCVLIGVSSSANSICRCQPQRSLKVTKFVLAGHGRGRAVRYVDITYLYC